MHSNQAKYALFNLGKGFNFTKDGVDKIVHIIIIKIVFWIDISNCESLYPKRRFWTKSLELNWVPSSFIYYLKSRSPYGAPLLGSDPSGLLDNVLHALRALRPCDPCNGAMIGQCIREIQKITEECFFKFFWGDFVLKIVLCIFSNFLFELFVFYVFFFFLFISRTFSGRFDTSGSLIPLSVSEISGCEAFLTCTRTRNWVF